MTKLFNKAIERCPLSSNFLPPCEISNPSEKCPIDPTLSISHLEKFGCLNLEAPKIKKCLKNSER